MTDPIHVPKWYRKAKATKKLNRQAQFALFKTPVETLKAYNRQLAAERRESIDRINRAQEEHRAELRLKSGAANFYDDDDKTDLERFREALQPKEPPTR